MKQFYTFLLLITFTISTFQYVSAQTSAKNGSLSDLAFIEGKWIAAVEGRSIEATWLPAKEGNIVGFFRMMNGGKPTVYELLVYEQTEQGLVSLVKHFKDGLIGQEEIDKPIRHKWIESSKGRVVFEKEGEAVRVLYEKSTDNSFVISLGKPENNKWVYKSLFEFSRAK